MTAEQQNKVLTLRDRFVQKRQLALSEWQFAADTEFKARLKNDAAREEWLSLDALVNAPDLTLLAIAEATR